MGWHRVYIVGFQKWNQMIRSPVNPHWGWLGFMGDEKILYFGPIKDGWKCALNDHSRCCDGRAAWLALTLSFYLRWSNCYYHPLKLKFRPYWLLLLFNCYCFYGRHNDLEARGSVIMYFMTLNQAINSVECIWDFGDG